MSAKLVVPRPRCAWLLAGLVLVPALPLAAAPLEPAKQADSATKLGPIDAATKYEPVKRDRFVVGSTTVRDNTTGLTWERSPPETRDIYKHQRSRCDALTMGGHGDWRLPRVEELLSLFEQPGETTHLVTGHPFTVSTQARWSATGSPVNRATVLVTNGSVSGEATTTPVAGWCVRGGEMTVYPGSSLRFSYVDGTSYRHVLDKRTKVVWRLAPVATVDWYRARNECRDEGPGWRLATMAEYSGLMDPGVPGSPKLPLGHPFSSTYAPTYDARLLWSSTQPTTAEAAVARFSDASSSTAVKTTSTISGYCVKGDPAAPRFSLVEGDTAVLDADTQLVWQRAVTYVKDTHGNHVAACAAKNAPGSTGWRLPTIREFETITDLKLDATPKLVTGHVFTGVLPDKYQLFWTADKDSYVSLFTFDIGRGAKAGPDPKDSKNFAWCVRPHLP